LNPDATRRSSAQTATLSTRRRAQPLVRGACLAGAALLLWPAATGTSLSILVPALSPFVAVAALLTTGAFHTATLVGLAVGVVAIVRGRLFCRWVCPAGLCLDGASRLGRCLGRRPYQGASVGRWLVLLTLGGACLGYPFLLWLDPLALFAGVFDLSVRGIQSGAWLSATAFVAVFALSVVWPNAWCGSACPLGAFQDVLYRTPRSVRTVLAHRGSVQRARDVSRLSRRAILGVTAGASLAGIAKLVRGQLHPPLRPPGARDESGFLGVCIRCGNCVRACPSGIIRRDTGQNGWASLLTPILSFRDDYCREDCVRCMHVCPSGALEPLLLEDKTRMQIGLPRMDMNVCLLAEDRECSACARACPYDAIRYVFSEAQYTLSPQIDAKRCTGCGACEAACPTTPKKAIIVLPAGPLEKGRPAVSARAAQASA